MNRSAQSKTFRKASKTTTSLFMAILSAAAATVQAEPHDIFATPAPEPTGYVTCFYVLMGDGSVQHWCKMCVYAPILGIVCTKPWAAKE